MPGCLRSFHDKNIQRTRDILYIRRNGVQAVFGDGDGYEVERQISYQLSVIGYQLSVIRVVKVHLHHNIATLFVVLYHSANVPLPP
jgi:hypothetical protein